MNSLTYTDPRSERLERFLANNNIASRREAKRFISSGNIKVNGKTIIIPGFTLKTNDIVSYKPLPDKETIIYYKPKGVETTKTVDSHKDIHDALPKYRHLAPVGRLDKDTEGLILLSNDGVLTKRATAGHDIEKEYEVTVREVATKESLARMARGILIDRKRTLPAKVTHISGHKYLIVLKEGRKHQIRRMAAACNLTIESLKRIRIGKIEISKMKAGEVKKINASDV